MKLRRICFLLIIGWTCTACQTATIKPDDTPTAPPVTLPAISRQPTLTPRLIDSPDPATIAPTLPSATYKFVLSPSAATPLPLIEGVTLPPLGMPPDSSSPPLGAPVSAPSVMGHSAGGLPLTVERFGSGERALLLIGGIHGGWEANTVTLMQELIAHFSSTPQDVLSGITLMIVPVANPDGLAYGRIPRGRFNGDGVDLNRNWSCEWSRDAFWRQDRVSPGLTSFSEPESVALANFMLQVRPAAALFYHSAANGVFAGNCGGDHGSAAMAAVVGKAAGYGYDAPFTAYPVTGVASNWADGQGIPSADVELQTATDSEYDRNLRGIMALQQWIAEN
ncbi:MAG: M14 family metallopeptidase [Chloroflexota bacterium]